MAIKEGLKREYYKKDLKSWLQDLHKIACSGIDGKNHWYRFDKDQLSFASPSEGIFARFEVM